MASCEQIKGLIQADVDGELPQAERLVLERHLSACEGCQALLEEQKAVAAAMFEAYAPHRLRDDLRDAVMAHLPEMDSPRPMRRISSYHTTPHPERKRSRIVTLLPALVSVVLLVLGLAIAFSWPPFLNEPGEAIGKVLHVSGMAHQAPAGSTVRTDAVLQEPVFSGQRFITASQSQLMLALSGPTFVKLDAESRMRVRNERGISLESGRAWLDVGSDGRYFHVYTPNGDVTVFGTKFDVVVDFDRTVVTVADGEVQVENDRTFTVLRGDNRVVVSLGQRHLARSEIDARAALAWAEAIQPDAAAERAFWAEIPKRVHGQVLPAEQVFAVRTMGRSVSSILLEWRPDAHQTGHSSYVVYITDEKMEPVYRGAVDGAVFDAATGNRHELFIEGGPIAGAEVLHIKVVPNIRDAGHESFFTGVSAVSK